MAVKNLTIMILPDGAKKVRQIKIPKYLIRFSFIVSIAVIALLGWIINDYKIIKTQIPELALKKIENKQLKTQLASLAHKFDKVNLQIAKYKELDNKLRIMVCASEIRDCILL